MKILEIRDNEGKTFDRYTVVYAGANGQGLYESLGMSDHPAHPQGFGQHSLAQPGDYLGKRIAFDELPIDCQESVRCDRDDGDGYIDPNDFYELVN